MPCQLTSRLTCRRLAGCMAQWRILSVPPAASWYHTLKVVSNCLGRGGPQWESPQVDCSTSTACMPRGCAALLDQDHLPAGHHEVQHHQGEGGGREVGTQGEGGGRGERRERGNRGRGGGVRRAGWAAWGLGFKGSEYVGLALEGVKATAKALANV